MTDVNLNTCMLVGVMVLQIVTIIVHVRKNRTLKKVLDSNAIAMDAVRVNNEALRYLNQHKLSEHGQKIDDVKHTVESKSDELKQTIVDASESGNKLKTLPPI